MMTKNEQQIQESRRDALVALNLDVASNLHNANDLYQEMLIDNQVSAQVMTSPVASATASIQQHINTLMLGMETNGPSIHVADVQQWNSIDSQYARWSADQALLDTPELYIDPTLRYDKSRYFKTLEDGLNSGQINEDRVQEVVLSYLGSFEELSNLEIVNGYFDRQDMTKAKYHFIGKTNSAPFRYYWRELDMSNVPENSNVITPDSWGDWEPIDISLDGETVLPHTVRPMYYNNRLYVAWVERGAQGSPNDAGDESAIFPYFIRMSYKLYDGTWSAPLTCLNTVFDESVVEKENIQFVFIADTSIRPERLFLGLFDSISHTEGEMPNIFEYQAFSSTLKKIPKSEVNESELIYWFNSFTSQTHLQHTIQIRDFNLQDFQTNVLHNSTEYDSTLITDFTPDLGVNQQGSNLELSFSTTQVIGEGIPVDSTPHSVNTNDVFNYIEVADCVIEADFVDLKVRFTSGYLRYIGDDYGSDFKSFAQSNTGYIGLADNQNKYVALLSNVNEGLVSVTVLDDGNEEGWYSDGEARYMFDLEGYELEFFSFDDLDDFINNRASFSLAHVTTNLNVYPYCSMETRLSKHRFWMNDLDNTNPIYSDWRTTSPADTVFQRDFDFSSEAAGSEYQIGYGVEFLNGDYLTKTVSFVYEEDNAGSDIIAPIIGHLEGNEHGIAHFVNFEDVLSDENSDRININSLGKQRLNTTFCSELVNRANISLPNLLRPETQLMIIEPPMEAQGTPESIDFYGANGLYFWELFFHLPLLVANKMNADQNYNGARQWLSYLFDPASPAVGEKPAYWNCAPIFPESQGETSRLATYVTDPDALAYTEPEVYRKAVYLAYVRNLMDMGDGFYRQLTPDALNNAKLRYVQALDLLGEKPEVAVLSQWNTPTLGAWVDDPSLPRDLEELEHQVLEQLPVLKSPYSPSMTTLFTVVSPQRASDEPAGDFMSGGTFVSPLNKELLNAWTLLETRLYNLRHNLTLDGKPLVMPLYAAPMDPNELQANAAANGGVIEAGASSVMEIPHYRFKALLPTTLSSVEVLRGYGQQLHSYLESGDRLGQEELQYQQLMEMGQVNITLQQEALSLAEAGKEALLANRAVTEQRHQHYKVLYDRHLTSTEQRSLSLAEAAKNTAISAGAMHVVMGASRMIPNIYGLAVGGCDFGGLLEGTAKALESAAGAVQQESQYLERSESYKRRREEWQIQYQQAELEMAAIDQQLIQQDIQITSAQTALAQAELQLIHHQQMYDYLLQRFTGRSLYQWLSSQLSTLYYQLYDATMAQCLALQAAWQYEMGDFVSQYVPLSAWNDNYRGLLAGEQLRLALMRMEMDYLKLNERRQEITKTISLKELVEHSNNVVGCDSWEEVVTALRDDGGVAFEFTKALFDGDYTDHYLRQLKWVSLSLPTLVGPYQDVRVTLTQTSNTFDIDGNDTLKSNLRASQTVTYSQGVDDSGLFVLNPEDERYLPFEGTGAISTWQLAFPQGAVSDGGFGDLAESKRQAMLDALSDIIIHVRYTAKQG